MKFSYKSFLPFGLLLVIFSAAAQMNSQQATEHAYQQEQIFQNQIRQEQAIRDGNNSSEQAAAAQREAQRQWQIRENKIQREIAELKRTPFYGAIAADVGTNHASWGGGYITKEIAIKKALERCKTDNCKIISVFSNSCVVGATPDNDINNINATTIYSDKDEKRVIAKAISECHA